MAGCTGSRFKQRRTPGSCRSRHTSVSQRCLPSPVPRFQYWICHKKQMGPFLLRSVIAEGTMVWSCRALLCLSVVCLTGVLRNPDSAKSPSKWLERALVRCNRHGVKVLPGRGVIR